MATRNSTARSGTRTAEVSARAPSAQATSEDAVAAAPAEPLDATTTLEVLAAGRPCAEAHALVEKAVRRIYEAAAVVELAANATDAFSGDEHGVDIVLALAIPVDALRCARKVLLDIAEEVEVLKAGRPEAAAPRASEPHTTCEPEPEAVWPGYEPVDATGARIARDMLAELEIADMDEHGVCAGDYCQLENRTRQGRPFRNIVAEYAGRAQTEGPGAVAAFYAVLSDFVSTTCLGSCPDIGGYGVVCGDEEPGATAS